MNDLFYPFVQKKLPKIRVKSRVQGSFQHQSLAEVLGPDTMGALANSSIYTKRALIKAYVRICNHNDHQLQKTKLGAGSNRSVKSTKAGRGMTRLPRAKVGKMVVSNVPQAVKGRLSHRLIKNATPLKMNRTQCKNARQSILYHLLRDGEIIVVPQQVFSSKTTVLNQYLQGLPESKGLRRVVIRRSRPGVRSTSNEPCILLDQNHHSLYRIGLDTERRILASPDGLRDLLLRVFVVNRR